MQNIIEILRLKYDAQLSHQKITCATGLSKGVVGKYISLAAAAGINNNWPFPDGTDQHALEKLLYPQSEKTPSRGLDVHTSAGSLENVYSIYKLPKAQLGIVQSDVLAFISTRNDESLRKIARKLRLVHPLYNEEVHILASNDVSSLEDLEGRGVCTTISRSNDCCR